MKPSKKSGIISLMILIAILLSNITHAQSLSEGIKDNIINFNEFLEKGEYENYSKVIDFLVFSLLFISIYMIGVRYAFRQLNKPEKVIAVVLGLMSALLLVAQGKSILSLVPLIALFLYFLLFTLIWWLLKGIKSKFGRFLLALLLTLIVILLIEGWLSGTLEELASQLE
ncbi:hypothetical protein HYX07_02280 [Candidatus Woesearchaeota archaeon]|nr:hypothetical protein [Candidatus Woesearchaeota archaeon]